MVSEEEIPLDEIQWRDENALAQVGGFVHTNTVLFYFARSPFFDRTSNNASLEVQAMNNPALFYVLQTRLDFEARLRTMSGLEFVVTGDPSNNGTITDNSCVWVIQKQYRQKRSGLEDEIWPTSAYFVVGENVYMAPSVGNILNGRILSTVTSLTKFFSTATTLPAFNPSCGNTYYPLTSKALSGAADVQSNRGSKETSPLPSMRSSQDQGGKAINAGSSATDHRSMSMLAETLGLISQYGKDYMDDSPLVGEPGSFILGRAKEAAPPSQSFQAARNALYSTRSGASPLPELKVDLPTETILKGMKAPERSPLTPMTAGGGKKRKKSKVMASTPR